MNIADYDRFMETNKGVKKDTPKVPLEWPCFVCGDPAGTSKEVILLCDKKACARTMGIIEINWEPAK